MKSMSEIVLSAVQPPKAKVSLKELLQRAKQISTLDMAVRPCLPADIRDYCRVLNIKEYEIVLGSPIHVFYCRLYYQNQDILREIQKIYPSIRNIRVKYSREHPEHHDMMENITI